MARQYSIAEARNHLPALVHAAEKGKAVELTRRGKPVAVLISADDYARLTHGRDPWGALEAFRRRHDLASLDADSVFEGVRDQSRGRHVRW